MTHTVPHFGYSVEATVVSEQFRLNELPKRFPAIFLVFEQLIYEHAEKFFPDYRKLNGYWEFVNLSNGGFYMRLRTSEPIRLWIRENYFSSTLSADAACIIVNLFVYARLGREFKATYLADHFIRLRRYASFHPECNRILEAIE